MTSLKFSKLFRPTAFFVINACKLLLGVEVKTEGEENIDKKESYLVIANHQSLLDALGKFT